MFPPMQEGNLAVTGTIPSPHPAPVMEEKTLW